MARAEMPAGLHRSATVAGLQSHIGILVEKLRRQRNHLLRRRRNLKMRKNFARNPLIHQNSAVLRVILELDDVVIAIVGFQQVRLSPAPHLTDEVAGVYRHAFRREHEFEIEEMITCPKKSS